MSITEINDAIDVLETYNISLTTQDITDILKSNNKSSISPQELYREMCCYSINSSFTSETKVIINKDNIDYFEIISGKPPQFKLIAGRRDIKAIVANQTSVPIQMATPTQAIMPVSTPPICLLQNQPSLADTLFFTNEIKNLRMTNDLLSSGYVYNNQIEASIEVIFYFYYQRNRWCLLLAEMQSGKSGAFLSVPYIIARNKFILDKLGIAMHGNAANVYLLTGMNEKELITQFENDIGTITGMTIKENVLHNSEMQTFLKKNKKDWSKNQINLIDKMGKNSLILIDESDYGASTKQILNKFLTQILNISPNGDNSPLKKNNIYVVSISATPMAEFLAANTLSFNKEIIKLKNAAGYYGILDMFSSNKVHQSFSLKTEKDIDQFIDAIADLKDVGYILVRANKKKNIAIRKRLEERQINFDVINHDQQEKDKSIDNKIKDKPIKKTLIFIKNLLRAGKRIQTDHIIMVHDTANSKADTAVQSLLGRCCGYSKNTNIEIYCDYDQAYAYRTWIENDYDLKLVPNKSKNIMATPGQVSIKSDKGSPILLDVAYNSEVLSVLSKAKKTKADKLYVLSKLNNHYIKDLLSKNTCDCGTFYNVDRTNSNTTIYNKFYLEPIKYNSFISDYSADLSDINKIIFSAAYNESENKLLVLIGKVVENQKSTSPDSMYHENNTLKVNNL